MISNSETIRISKMLKGVQEGYAWHGPNLNTILEGITAEQAIQKPIEGAHSIWELVLHMTAWRDFCLGKLKGDDEFQIELNTESDWPSITDSSEVAWEATKSQYKAINAEIGQVLRNVNDENLLEITAGKPYTMHTLIHGILQHDTYHAGQIMLLKKLTK